MFNQVTIGGRITQDLELKSTTNGTPVLNFSIAINEKRGEEERTVFVDITTWKDVAENTAKYMKKGQPVLVSGRLSQDTWEDHGQNRSKLFVTGERVVFLGPRVEAEASSAKKSGKKSRDRHARDRVGSLDEVAV